jgi:hypothetical protein
VHIKLFFIHNKIKNLFLKEYYNIYTKAYNISFTIVREAPRYPALNMRSSFANEFLSTYRAESRSIKTPSSNSLSTPLT